MTITPGIHDLTKDAYFADPTAEPSLSASIIKILITETPIHAWTAHPRLNPNYERTEEDKFDLGNAAHALMLHDPQAFSILQFDNWRTKDAQNAKAEARKAGKIPMLADNWQRVCDMVEAGRAQLLQHRDASEAFANGKGEQTIIWQEGATWFRSKLDWMPDKPTIFYDYKTTGSADPDTWQKIAFQTGADIQAAFYRRGIRALELARNPRMRFVVQETTEPYALSVCEFSPESLELADRRIGHAIKKWEWCMKHHEWPGYPDRTVTLEAPPWHESQLMAREQRDADLAKQLGAKDDIELLAFAMKMQSPI
ncbi:MAG TPA: PD-(D/E)XK nuclease-like domain-containing protein [Terracidiphilus sp.]